ATSEAHPRDRAPTLSRRPRGCRSAALRGARSRPRSGRGAPAPPRAKHRPSRSPFGPPLITKRPPFGGLYHSVPKGKLDRLDVRGLSALGALHDLELNTLTFGQRLVTLLGDRREVHEDVFATLTLDEPIALLVREPLHGALSQRLPPSKTRDGPGTEPPLRIQRPESSSDAGERKRAASVAGRSHGVFEQACDRHRPDAARDGSEECGDIRNVRLDVAEEPLVRAVHPDVDHGSALLDHVRGDQIELPDGDEEDVRIERVAGQVFGPPMADRDGGDGTQEQHGNGTADEQAALA